MPDPIAGHTAERIPRSGSEQTEQRVEPHPHQNHQHDLGTERQDTPGDESREKKTDITPVGKKLRQRSDKFFHAFGFHPLPNRFRIEK
jgi:hypothetical protein